MFLDERRFEVWQEIRQHGIRAFARQLTPSVLSEAGQRAGLAVAKSPLCVVNLAWLGIAAALHKTQDFATILTATLKLLEDQQAFYATAVGRAKRGGARRGQGRRRSLRRPRKNPRRAKHSPYRDDPTQVSEEAFVKARRRMPLEFWVNLIIVLNERFGEQHGSLLEFRGFRLLAMDGTTIDLPNWKRLREHFGAARNASGNHSAQARMVMLQFPRARLPYRYELCPLDQGEATIARRLVQHVRPNDLLLMDACFGSYGLLWDIQRRGASFAFPIKRNLNLTRTRRLGRHDELVRWTPKDSRGQWRKEGLPKAIELRVITYQWPGFRPQQMATNVLCEERIPRADWVRLAAECSEDGEFHAGLYHRRWEIETTYRELKVEQGLEGGLRSRTPDSIQFEVAGHVVLYLLVRWLIVEAAVRAGRDPLRLSFKHALRELLALHASLVTAAPTWLPVLFERLLHRIAEHEVSYRPGRSYPRRKQSTNYKKKTKKNKPNSSHPKSKVKPKAAKNKG
jgi:hypothetical protein